MVPTSREMAAAPGAGDAGPFLIRPATAADREPTLAYCQDTFDWGDYIHEVWDQWFHDPEGILLVAEADGVPIAVGRASTVSGTEGWLEGLRVHPSYRRRGAADAMNAAGCHWLWQRGVEVARLATGVDNAPAQRQVTRLGFQAVATFDYWVAPPWSGGDAVPAAHVRPVEGNDGETLLAIKTSSAVGEAAGSLLAVGWRWRTLTAEDLHRAATQRNALVAPAAFALVHDSADGVRVGWVDGQAAAWPAFLAAARERAGANGLHHVSALLPALPVVAAAATAAGFVLEASFGVYERLRPARS